MGSWGPFIDFFEAPKTLEADLRVKEASERKKDENFATPLRNTSLYGYGLSIGKVEIWLSPL